MNIDNLDVATREKLSKLAYAREETEKHVLDVFGEETIRCYCPKSISRYIRDLRHCSIVDSGISADGLAWVRLVDGHLFYSHLSNKNHEKQFDLTKDVLPEKLTSKTFLCGIEIAHRYATDGSWVPSMVLPDRGGTVVECGAYLGHTAIRFAEDVVGPQGRVLAIEMMPDNVMILRRNVIENGLRGRVDVIEAGVWSCEQELPVVGKKRQRNSIAPLDKFKCDDTGTCVQALPLDSILEQWGHAEVDLLYITVNGAEVEALEGLKAWANRVRHIVIRAPYMRGGIATGSVCRDLLKEKGFVVIQSKSQDQFLVAQREA